MTNGYKNINNPNLEYVVKDFSFNNNYFLYEPDRSTIILISNQYIREFDTSKNENGTFVRQLNCIIVSDNGKDIWLFEKNTCLNQKEVPDIIKQAIKEFANQIPKF